MLKKIQARDSSGMKKGYVRGWDMTVLQELWLSTSKDAPSLEKGPTSMPVIRTMAAPGIKSFHPSPSQAVKQWISCPSRKPLVKTVWCEDSSLLFLQKKRLEVVSIFEMTFLHMWVLLFSTQWERAKTCPKNNRHSSCYPISTDSSCLCSGSQKLLFEPQSLLKLFRIMGISFFYAVYKNFSSINSLGPNHYRIWHFSWVGT